MTREQMLADLALRGWVAQCQSVYRRISPTHVRVCGVLSRDNRAAFVTIPWSYVEDERQEQAPYDGPDYELEKIHAFIASGADDDD